MRQHTVPSFDLVWSQCLYLQSGINHLSQRVKKIKCDNVCGKSFAIYKVLHKHCLLLLECFVGLHTGTKVGALPSQSRKRVSHTYLSSDGLSFAENLTPKVAASCDHLGLGSQPTHLSDSPPFLFRLLPSVSLYSPGPQGLAPCPPSLLTLPRDRMTQKWMGLLPIRTSQAPADSTRP